MGDFNSIKSINGLKARLDKDRKSMKSFHKEYIKDSLDMNYVDFLDAIHNAEVVSKVVEEQIKKYLEDKNGK